MTASAPTSAWWRSWTTVTPGQPAKGMTQAGGPHRTTDAPSAHEGVEVRAGDPRMGRVTHDHDPRALQRAEGLAQGEGVQQGLGRMGVGAVTAVEHRHRLQRPGGEVRALRWRAWRSTIIRIPVRSMVRRVSTRDSPLATLLPATDRSVTVAPSSRAASSNDTRVRVEASKKASPTGVAAQRIGQLAGFAPSAQLRSQVEDPLEVLARQLVDVEQVPPRPGDRPRQRHPTDTSDPWTQASAPSARVDDDLVAAIGLQQSDVDDLVRAGRQVLAHEVGPDGELAMPAVHHHRQADRPRPAVIGQRVQGGADGAPGVEDVVDQDHGPVGDLGTEVGALDDRGVGQPGQVVAVEGDVQRADRQADAARAPR